MDEAKQGFCVLAGGGDFIRDSMLAAMLAKNQIFPSLNLLVVPVDMGVSDGDGGKGFGKPLSYEEEGYVAAPADVSLCVFFIFCGISGVSSFQYWVFAAWPSFEKCGRYSVHTNSSLHLRSAKFGGG